MKYIACILSSACTLMVPMLPAQDAPGSQPKELSRWIEMVPPRPGEEAKRNEWFYAANWATLEWRVFRSSTGEACAEPTSSVPTPAEPVPKFVPRATKVVRDSPLKYHFTGCKAWHRTDDGWLVGFNRGEFGAALYWFSEDGSKSYEISGHQVVDFATSGDAIFAVEGLAHLTMNKGSVIHIEKQAGSSRWKATEVITLPSAPYAVSTRKDGTLVITLSKGLATMNRDGKLENLFQHDPWRGLYPNSSLLSNDETKLYIGMRQFVVEVDLQSHRLRYLLPNAKLLNKKAGL